MFRTSSSSISKYLRTSSTVPQKSFFQRSQALVTTCTEPRYIKYTTAINASNINSAAQLMNAVTAENTLSIHALRISTL